MSEWLLLLGDARETLATLPAASVQTCVTSPPYFGLRDYGMAGQIGLEATPDAYVAQMVAVFRDVRRVLRDDATAWINLGDSYAGSWGAQSREHAGKHAPNVSALSANQVKAAGIRESGTGSLGRTPGCKAKDLVGIPWMVAKALRDPYYSGTIRNELDRVWLAAMLDAEGCMFIHKRKAGQHNGQGYYRQNASYGPGVEISNTSLAVVERIMALVGKGSICSQGPDQNARRKQTIYRWNLRTVECRDFVREVYPYLVAKRQQARILYGCPASGERAEAAHEALMSLHRTGESGVDFPDIPSMFEPGYYLRSDIIWNKCNPMPESVTDRPTKAHEYIFLLTKSARYYYDAAAIAEAASENKPWAASSNGGAKAALARRDGGVLGQAADGTRNKRSVWTVATQPYPEAHFATYPEDLITPCVLAGTSEKGECPACGKAWERITGRDEQPQAYEDRKYDRSDPKFATKRNMGARYQAQLDANPVKTLGWQPVCACNAGDPVPQTVLDPFTGSGTTGAVAVRHQRSFVGCELNAAYLELARTRIGNVAPMFANEATA